MRVRTIEGPDGQNYVEYDCPGCKTFEPHSVHNDFGHRIPFGGGKWDFNGDLDRPTISPSILSNIGGASSLSPICHHFVKDGRIQYLSDCTHAMAGQTVDLPEVEEATLS